MEAILRDLPDGVPLGSTPKVDSSVVRAVTSTSQQASSMASRRRRLLPVSPMPRSECPLASGVVINARLLDPLRTLSRRMRNQRLGATSSSPLERESTRRSELPVLPDSIPIAGQRGRAPVVRLSMLPRSGGEGSADQQWHDPPNGSFSLSRISRCGLTPGYEADHPPGLTCVNEPT